MAEHEESGEAVLDFEFLDEYKRVNPPSVSKRLRRFLRKYFQQQQSLTTRAELQKRRTLVSWYVEHRRLVSFIIPFTLVQIAWWSYAGSTNSFHLFIDEAGNNKNPRWFVTLTMIFGSILAGASSEGGAAVAFSVLTLAMGIAPTIARDFSFLIQSVGMSAAAFSIWFMGIKVEVKSIVYCTIGGIGGVIFGLEEIAPKLEPEYSKMYFVCIWFAFAFSLFWLNYFHNTGRVFVQIPVWKRGEIFRMPILNLDSLARSLHREERVRLDFVVNWWAILLVAFGFLGGIFSSMSGSGLDICSFALLTLYFRVTERVATPTSVILMAINTIVAFLYRRYQMGDVDDEVYNLWFVCIPVVVVGAPLGAIISSHFHRNVLSALIYVTDTVQLAGALYVIEPWTYKNTDTPIDLCVDSAVILFAGGMFFTVLAFAGMQQLEMVEDDNMYEDKSLPCESSSNASAALPDTGRSDDSEIGGQLEVYEHKQDDMGESDYLFDIAPDGDNTYDMGMIFVANQSNNLSPGLKENPMKNASQQKAIRSMLPITAATNEENLADSMPTPEGMETIGSIFQHSHISSPVTKDNPMLREQQRQKKYHSPATSEEDQKVRIEAEEAV